MSVYYNLLLNIPGIYVYLFLLGMLISPKENALDKKWATYSEMLSL